MHNIGPNLEDQSLFISLTESLQLNLAEMFRGKNLQYSLVGKVASEFNVQQSMHLLNSEPFLNGKEQFTLIQSRPLQTTIGLQWVNSFAILIEIQGEYRIYYSNGNIINTEIRAPNFDKYVLVAVQQDNIICHDFDYIDSQTFIVSCLQSTKYYLISIDINSIKKVSTFDITGNHQDLKRIKMELLNQDKHTYVLIGYPIYGVQSQQFITDCQIDVFKLDIFNNPSAAQSLQIDKELLKIIYKNQYAQFNLMDFKISAKQELIIFDKYNATIQFKLDINANKWINIRLHNPTNGDYKSFALFNDQIGNTQILILYNTNQIMTITGGYIKQQWTMYFDFDEDYPKVQYSEKYIVILDNHVLRVFAYNRDDSYTNFYLYEKELPNILGFILNPHINDIIIINKDSIERYTISQGYLLMKPFTQLSTEPLSFQIVASNPISECQTRINYAIYSNIDSTIYPAMGNTEPISDTIFYPIIPQYSIIRIMANSGPNQQMECKIQSDFQSVHISTDFKKPLQVKGLQKYDKKNVISALFSVNPGQNSQLFFILQFQNDEMYDTQIYYCTENTVYQFLDCNIINELTSKLETKLNQNLFSLTYERNYRFNITMAYADQKIVHIYGYLLDGLTFYRKYNSNHYINSLIISDSLLYIFYRSMEYIQIYDFELQQDILIIDSIYMLKLGFTQLWKPQQFDCNIDYNPTIFAVVNQNSVIIMKCLTDCIIIKIIPFIEPTQLRVNIQNNGLLIVFYFRYDAQQILEYDLTDLYFITLNKQYELYHYILMEPIQFFNNPLEEYFYIAAYTPLKKQHVILVFKSGILLRESLQTIIETKKYYQESQDLVFTISGKYSKVQYFNNGDEEYFYIFNNYLQSSISLSQEFDPIFIHEAQINSTFFNIDLPTRQEYQQTIKFVYLQTDIDVNEQFRQGLNINFDQVQDKTKILIAQDWFHGQIASYSVKCEQCKNQITVTQPIEIISTKDFGDTKFIDKCYLGINNVYAHLTKNNLMFLDSDYFEALQLIPLNMDSQYTCKRIFCSPNTSWLFVYCESREYQGSLQLYDCLNGIGCKKIGTIKDLLDIYALNSLIQVNDNIILQSQEYASQSMISIYRITIFENEWQLISGMKITKKEADQSFRITNIQIQQYKVNGIQIYKLFLTENSKGILWFDLVFNNKILVLSGLIQNMNLKNVIKDNNLYVSTYSQYLNILITSEMKELISDGITEFHFLIVTQSEEHYGLRVQFKGLLLYKIIIAYLLHPFAGWPTNTASATLNGYVLLAYNSQYESITLMSVYKIPEVLKNDLRDSPTLMYGAVLFPHIYNVDLNIGLYSENENQISVNYNTNTSILQKAFIHKQGFISIKDIDNIYEQTITLTAQNYFYQNEIKIDLTQGEKIVGFNYMYLIYVGIAIVIFLLVVVFICVYCRRKNKVIDVVPLLN